MNTAETHYGVTPPEALREAIGPLAACGKSGADMRTACTLDVVTCAGCRRAVDAGVVAMWEVEAEAIQARYLREMAGVRRQMVGVAALRVLAYVIAVAALLGWAAWVVWLWSM
ncbi:hypothetical protein AB0K40_17900 [Nonomuraea bangladeshensis]|uniref:Uncharacterized protein n=1 Tax=Nonomuraea bangladeshensis TaxID=404385 RepID=A0ABV3H4F2_9ACTN